MNQFIKQANQSIAISLFCRMFAYTVDYINFYLYIFSIYKESLRVQAPEYLHIDCTESYNYSDTIDYPDWRIGWFYANYTDVHAKN